MHSILITAKIDFDSKPEILPDTPGIEPVHDTGPPYLREQHPIELSAAKKSYRKAILLGVIILMLVAAVGLGIGLGVTRSKSNTSSPPAPLTHGAMNDTSLASLVTMDNDRHIFFQDVNGTLSSRQREWLPSVDYVHTQQKPRNNTPIATWELSANSGTVILVYFVVEDNTLAAVRYRSSGVFDYMGSESSSMGSLLNRSLSVPNGTRSLSLSTALSNQTLNLSTSPSTISAGYLYFEDPTHNVTVLEGRMSSPFSVSGHAACFFNPESMHNATESPIFTNNPYIGTYPNGSCCFSFICVCCAPLMT